MTDTAADLLAGSRRALARAITAVENDAPEAEAILRAVHPHTGGAHVIGVTGPPGAGKSTLTDHIAKAFRAAGERVGIVAVDPSSPFSGGAILGDRIRMGDLALDPGVFIRSMASRGSLGGLARHAADAAALMDAAGMGVVLVETVGVGQSEVDIARAADTTVVVLVPGQGDGVQAIKAGILEIADIFAINKADRDGVPQLEAELNAVLDLAERRPAWRPPVLRTVAKTGDGVAELAENIVRHLAHLRESGGLESRRLARAEAELLARLEEGLRRRVVAAALPPERLAALAARVVRREADPYTLTAELLAECFAG
ncbi:methylmalonyl Co-A mutase-associated GTPase MeaB [Oleispirillum naphthae]|uniref:methylmalonyl Co-A mutase-associated GTPase MeaB n=1 Tax=Oleispirillum naphthae TaxID=2838853 RepID=UPI0030823420